MNQPALFRGLHPTMKQVVDKDRAAKPLTAKDLAVAEKVWRNLRHGCEHDPKCTDWQGCIRRLAREMKQKGYL